MSIRKIWMSATLVLLAFAAFAQTLSPRVLPATGGFGTVGNMQLQYTIGEPLINTFTGGGTELSLGFEQPESKILGDDVFWLLSDQNTNLIAETGSTSDGCYDRGEASESAKYISNGYVYQCANPYNITLNGDIGSDFFTSATNGAAFFGIYNWQINVYQPDGTLYSSTQIANPPINNQFAINLPDYANPLYFGLWQITIVPFDNSTPPQEVLTPVGGQPTPMDPNSLSSITPATPCPLVFTLVPDQWPMPGDPIVGPASLCACTDEACFSINPNNFTLPASYLNLLTWDFGDGFVTTMGCTTNPLTGVVTCPNGNQICHKYINPGVYTVTATWTSPDANPESCYVPLTASTTVHVTNPIVYFNYTENCATLNFTSTVSCANASLNPTYLWSFGDGTTSNQQNPPAHTYAPGIYSVSLTYTDDCGNTSSVTKTITAGRNSAIAINPTVTNVCSATTCNGGIALNITDNNPNSTPNTFHWSNGSTLQNTSLLCAGTYHVTVTDFLGCSASIASTVQNYGISITVTPTQPSCGLSNGQISATASDPAGNHITYSWSQGGASTSSISNIGAGPYTVTASDAVCSATAIVTLTQTSVPVNIALISACNSITATVTGGTNHYTYGWSNGETSSTISTLPSGTYALTITDLNGCSGTASKTINVATINSITSQGSCLEQTTNNGAAAVNVSGGTTPYTFSWSNGETTSSISGLAVGTYTVDVTDNTNCTVSASVTVDYMYCCPLFEAEHVLTNTSTSAIETTLLTNGQFNGQRVIINGQLLVNTANFGFVNNTTVRLNPGATIVLDNGRSLTIDASYLYPCSDIMWQGIVMPYSNNLLSVTNGSHIIGAQIAIDAQKNGDITVDNSSILDCYNGIHIGGLSTACSMGGGNGSTITNSTIDGNFTSISLSPYNLPATNVGAKGIEIVKVKGLTIGSAGHGNIIQNFQVGISGYNSAFTSTDNIIQNIPISTPTIFSYNNIGQYSISGTGIYNQCPAISFCYSPPLVISQLSTQCASPACANFINCGYAGVYVDNANLTAIQNYMFNVPNGVIANNKPAAVITVSNNTFDQYQYGVSISGNVQAANVNISGNNLKTLTIPNSNAFYTGIQFNDVVPHAQKVTISNNLIHDAKYAIIVRNALVPTGSNKFSIFNNTMDNPNTVADVGAMYGCGLLQCKGLTVYGNNYVGFGTGPVGNSNTPSVTYGFLGNRSPNSSYFCNLVQNSEFGFFYAGNNLNTSFTANHMGNGGPCAASTLGYGLFLGPWFGTGDIGIQGGVNCYSNGNQFFGPFQFAGTYNANGNNAPTTRFYYKTGGNELSPSNLHNTGVLSIQFNALGCAPIFDWGNFCSARCNTTADEPAGPPTAEMLVRKDDDATNESIALGLRDNEVDAAYYPVVNYDLQKYLYQNLKLHVDSGSIDSLSDSILKAFYLENIDSTIGYFSRVDSVMQTLADTGLLADSSSFVAAVSAAQANNKAYQCVTKYNIYEQSMSDIGLSYMVSNTGFTANQLSLISTLAYSCPFIYGDAVYTARSYYIANFDVTANFDDSVICAGGGEDRMLRVNNKTKTKDSTATIVKSIVAFPSPANTNVNLVTSLNVDESGIIDIFDISGVRVSQLKTSGGVTSNAVDISNLSNGVYMYYLHTSEQYTARGKIVIAH